MSRATAKKPAPLRGEQEWRVELDAHLRIAGDVEQVEGQGHNQLARAAAQLLERYDNLQAKYADEVRRHNLLMRDSTNDEQRLKDELAHVKEQLAIQTRAAAALVQERDALATRRRR